MASTVLARNAAIDRRINSIILSGMRITFGPEFDCEGGNSEMKVHHAPRFEEVLAAHPGWVEVTPSWEEIRAAEHAHCRECDEPEMAARRLERPDGNDAVDLVHCEICQACHQTN